MQVTQYKKYGKKVPLNTSTLLSLKQHCLTIFLYAKSEQYEERSSRVEDIHVFPVNTLNQYNKGFLAEGSCLSFLCQDGRSFLSVYLNVLTTYYWSSSGEGVNFFPAECLILCSLY